MECAYNNGMVEETVSARKIIKEQNSEIKQLKEQLEAMGKAMKAQEEFIVDISHELKTPLNVLSATVQLFNMHCNSGSLDKIKGSISKYINSMNQNCYRLSKLINNIVEIVEDIVMSVTNFTDSKGINIIFDTDTEEKVIACDPEKIERVVLNLISNAIKFSDKGDEIFIDVKDKDEFVEISVKDNGIGIEEKNLVVLFDRFKQVDKSLSRNTEGTGIGLSLVKSIVELHSGRIYAESEVGKGSKFTFKLPSRNITNENVIHCNKISSKNESVKVELSDIHL